MEPYDTVPVTDVFAASTETFEYLLGELAGPGSAELSHARLEEMIEVRGRLLLRQLLQDHLDLRAAREEQALARRTPVRPAAAGWPVPTVCCAAVWSPVIIGCWPPSSGRCRCGGAPSGLGAYATCIRPMPRYRCRAGGTRMD